MTFVRYPLVRAAAQTHACSTLFSPTFRIWFSWYRHRSVSKHLHLEEMRLGQKLQTKANDRVCLQGPTKMSPLVCRSGAGAHELGESSGLSCKLGRGTTFNLMLAQAMPYRHICSLCTSRSNVPLQGRTREP